METTTSSTRSSSFVDVQSDKYDELQATVTQLDALLESFMGASFAAFEGHSPEIRQNLLWLASDMAGRAVKLMSGDA